MKKSWLLITAVLLLLFGLVGCKTSKKLTQQKKDLKNVYTELKRDMAEAIIIEEENGVKVILPEAVLFKINKAEINTEYLPILKRMADVLKKYPDIFVLISGYTDITGTKEFNLDLSRRRAESAQTVLEKNNVKASHIYTWGKGQGNPIADNTTEAGRAQNRRVEFVIMYNYEPTKK